jgi:hypothetical protein
MRSQAEHWRNRAAEYREQAEKCLTSEARTVWINLAMRCAGIAQASESHGPLPMEVELDENAARWRQREETYRRIADGSTSADGRAAWLLLAQRCDEIASYLEEKAAAVA